jgi:sorbitol-specific phosphotransferase system component IIA
MSGILGENDIAAILADLVDADATVEVAFGTLTATGLLDRTAIQIFDGEMPTTIADGEAVHIQAGALPGLEPGSAITVAGTSYTVRAILLYGDGAMERISLTAR